MNLIFCLDNHNGIRFNGRRQSRDMEVYRHICVLVGTSVLFLNKKSASLFDKFKPAVTSLINLEPLPAAIQWLFTENAPSDSLLRNASKLIVYRWNRDYPADEFVDLSGWRIIDSVDFKGNSHEKITQEVYIRD